MSGIYGKSDNVLTKFRQTQLPYLATTLWTVRLCMQSWSSSSLITSSRTSKMNTAPSHSKLLRYLWAKIIDKLHKEKHMVNWFYVNLCSFKIAQLKCIFSWRKMFVMRSENKWIMLFQIGRMHRGLKPEGLGVQMWDEFGDSIIESLRRFDAVRKHKELRRAWLAIVVYITDNLKQVNSYFRFKKLLIMISLHSTTFIISSHLLYEFFFFKFC